MANLKEVSKLAGKVVRKVSIENILEQTHEVTPYNPFFHYWEYLNYLNVERDDEFID